MEDWKIAKLLTVDLIKLKARAPEDFARVKAVIEDMQAHNEQARQPLPVETHDEAGGGVCSY